ncbi:MAG TPA: cation-transporting P-type ATPase, partial [Elusimicrobiales bacterium]|nr:cation-transporting P-type ATPase [Elusimicrobiales bacterium]
MWYKKTIEEIKNELNTDIEKGLGYEEVKARAEKYGKNKLPEAEPINYFKIILEQIKNPLIYILI